MSGTNYIQRRKKLASIMKREEVEAFLITNVVNVSYLTGFSGDDSWLLLAGKDAILISDSRYEEQIKEQCPELEYWMRPARQSMYEAVKVLLKSWFPKKKEMEFGFEADSFTIYDFNELREVLGINTFVPLVDTVERLREIKDKTEIEAIRNSLRCARRAFEIVRSSLRPDQSETDIRNDLEYNMFKLGAEGVGFPSIVAVGPRAALPHAVPMPGNFVRDSDHLLIDWGAKKDFYISDLTRVLITTKKPSDKLRKIYNIVLSAQKAAIAAIRPGIASGEIDKTARSFIEKAGYGKMFGHGLGMQVHERGGFRIGAETVLKPGMILTVEPGIYLPGWGGIRIEDDVLITKDGCEVLSEGFPKEFDEMIVDL
ncbi:MAG: Xaa-Pro peptidase family protein [Planctomycetia bacterium]|nr:Xaa-Pro peptidase family protein [Planctomycetia bacterium]